MLNPAGGYLRSQSPTDANRRDSTETATGDSDSPLPRQGSRASNSSAGVGSMVRQNSRPCRKRLETNLRVDTDLPNVTLGRVDDYDPFTSVTPRACFRGPDTSYISEQPSLLTRASTLMGLSGGSPTRASSDLAKIQRFSSTRSSHSLYQSGNLGCFKLNPEDRGITVKQLRKFWKQVENACLKDTWTEFGQGRNQNLQPDECNLHHIGHYVLAPVTAPDGVVLSGLAKRCYKENQEIVQKLTGARGFVKQDCEGTEVAIKVTRGKFEKPYWSDTFGDLLMEWVSLQTDEVVATPISSTSYVELIARRPQHPIWFCSFWTGHTMKSFFQAVEHHAHLRSMTENTPYWIDVFANNPHEAEDHTDFPKRTGFYRALNSMFCEGFLLLLNAEREGVQPAVAFDRLWSVFELSLAIEDTRRPLVDMATVGVDHHGDEKVELLTDGLTKQEKEKALEEMAWGMDTKLTREASFPVTVIERGLGVHLERARVFSEADRRRILNFLAGRPVDEEPPKQHEAFTRVNAKIRAHFAEFAWPTAMARGLVNKLDLPRMLKEDCERTDLSMFMAFRKEVDDSILASVVDSFSEHLLKVSLNVSHCPLITDKGLSSLAKGIAELPRLTSFTFEIKFNKNVTPFSVDRLGVALAGLSRLEELTIKFCDCSALTDNCHITLAARLGFQHLQHVDWIFSNTYGETFRVQSPDEMNALLAPSVAPLVPRALNKSKSGRILPPTARSAGHRTDAAGRRFVYVVPPQLCLFSCSASSDSDWLVYGEIGETAEWMYSNDWKVYMHCPTETLWHKRGHKVTQVVQGVDALSVLTLDSGEVRRAMLSLDYNQVRWCFFVWRDHTSWRRWDVMFNMMCSSSEVLSQKAQGDSSINLAAFLEEPEDAGSDDDMVVTRSRSILCSTARESDLQLPAAVHAKRRIVFDVFRSSFEMTGQFRQGIRGLASPVAPALRRGWSGGLTSDVTKYFHRAFTSNLNEIEDD